MRAVRYILLAISVLTTVIVLESFRQPVTLIRCHLVATFSDGTLYLLGWPDVLTSDYEDVDGTISTDPVQNDFVIRAAKIDNRIVFPIWLVPLLTIPVWFVPHRRARERRRRTESGACLSCGYDLTGNESGVCSECGSACGQAE